MVAFVLSWIVAFLITGGIVAYSKRRPVDVPMTWGEAMLSSLVVFFLMFWSYGVVPHQWLVWADNELNWRVDKFVVGPGGILKHSRDGGIMPIDITYVVLRDVIALLIYGIILGANIALWAMWQKRGKDAVTAAPERSAFGRPLIKEGSSS
ncbi:MAG: hypothetical protein GWP48_02160 [Actinobacteria bacterium]|nr:hypothetical protein [Actinomycetota bacterium]